MNGNADLARFAAKHLKPGCMVAEVGVYKGETTRLLDPIVAERDGELHLFDFDDHLESVSPECRFVKYGNSRRLLDSYCWSLSRLLPGPRLYDLVYLDGAHSWAIDALAFLLLDRLIKDGGYIWVDDLHWNMAGSLKLFSHMGDRRDFWMQSYTDEQLRACQVAMVADKLIRSDPRYKQIGECVWQRIG